jgi:hypothetical protein
LAQDQDTDLQLQQFAHAHARSGQQFDHGNIASVTTVYHRS